MDWNLAITRNREALLHMVSALFALLTSARLGGSDFMIPRHVWRAVLMVLRPAESAMRRLIVIAARDLQPICVKPRIANFASRAQTNIPRQPTFRLIDPLRDTHLDHDSASLWGVEFVSDDASDQPACALDTPMNAERLHNRLRALRHALSNIDKQSRRLARWYGRRDVALKANQPHRLSPIRPGLAPSWRRRIVHEVDHTLHECHGLARDLLNTPNTS
jgi:hypothetical protein